MHFTYEQRLALEFYLKGSNLFPKTPNTHNLALLVKKDLRLSLCELFASLYARDSHAVMRIARIAVCESLAPLDTKPLIRNAESVGRRRNYSERHNWITAHPSLPTANLHKNTRIKPHLRRTNPGFQRAGRTVKIGFADIVWSSVRGWQEILCLTA